LRASQEAAQRSLFHSDPHVDPVGSLVGQRGVRVSTVTAALGGERIDVIDWSEDAQAFIKESLSPASVVEVVLNEEDHRATVTVTEDQQSLAIGRGGQNVRLAAKLTGWNIDIISIGGQTVADSDGSEAAVSDAVNQPKQNKETTTMDTSENEIEATEEQIDDGAIEIAQAQADTSVDDDQPEVDSLEGMTEQNMMVAENDPESSELSAEEETAFTDNGSVADARESRDETSESIADNG
jgi:N utilization substance protein A